MYSYIYIVIPSSFIHLLPSHCSSLTQWSDQSQASQGVERAEHGPQGFDPHWDGAVRLFCVWALRKTPGLHQDYLLYSAGQRQKTLCAFHLMFSYVK